MSGFSCRRLAWLLGLLPLALALSPGSVAAQYTTPQVRLDPHHGGIRDVTDGAANVTYTTPAYTSWDTPRAVTFLYSSGQMDPQGLVQVEAQHSSGTLPAKMSIRLWSVQFNHWMTFPNGSQELYYQVGSGWNRLAAQFEAASGIWGSGAHSFDVVVTSYWGDGTIREAAPVRVRVPIVSERVNPFGRGWSLVGLQWLRHQGDGVFITEGDGRGLWFPGTQSGGYTSPDGDFTTVVWDAGGGTWNRTYPDGTRVRFGWNGVMLDVMDRFGNVTAYSYDGNNRLTAITDPAGKQITFGYTGLPGVGALAWVKDPANRTVTTTTVGYYPYRFNDPDGVRSLDLHFVNDVLERYWTRGQDRSVVGNDGSWSFIYDIHGQMASITAPKVSTTDAGQMRPVTSFKSLEVAVLPGSGKGTSSNPAVRVVPGNVRVETTDPRGYVTKAAVDRFRLATRIEQPLSRATTMVRNADGQVTRETSPAGAITDSYWDGVELDSVVNVTTGHVTRYRYGPYHQVEKIWDNSADSTRFYVNSAGLADSVRVSSDLITKYGYGSNGRLQWVISLGGHRTDYCKTGSGAYNCMNTWQNTDRTTESKGTTSYELDTYHTYDAVGRQVTTTRPAAVGYGTDTISVTAYNTLNQLTSTKNRMGHLTSYQYHPSAALKKVTDPKGQEYQYNVDALGRVTSEIDPRKLTNSYTYYYFDRSGNTTKVKNRRGQEVLFSFDALNRVTGRYTPESQATLWSYGQGTQSDRWVQVSNDVSTDRFEYDAAGRPTQQITTRASGMYTLQTNHGNAWGQRQSLTVSGPSIGPFTTTYGYDTRRRVNSMNPGAGNTTISNGLAASANRFLPIAVQLRRPTTSAGLSEGLDVYALPGGYTHPADVLGMEYFNGGPRILVERREDQVNWWQYDREYEYDSAGRLVTYQDQVTSLDPNCQTYCNSTIGGPTYMYDVVGNNGSASAGNRMSLSHGGHYLSYDADGNITQRYKTGFNQTLTWNSSGDLTRVTTDGVPRDYRYDGLGRWVQTIAGGSTTEFVYDGEQIVLERSPAGVVTQYHYYPGVDQLHSMTRSGATYYYITDPAGTVQGLLDSSQNLVAKFNPWVFGGRHTVQETVVQPFGFQGRPLDRVTGLYNFRARWYDPDAKRFVSEDPIGIAGGINPYVFANNDPINGRDPSGLSSCPWGLICLPGITVIGAGGSGPINPLGWWLYGQRRQTESSMEAWWADNMHEILRNYGQGPRQYDVDAIEEMEDLGAGIGHLGLGGSLIVGVGVTGAVGLTYSGSEGPGVYGEVGVGAGLDVGGAIQGGYDPSRSAFTGGNGGLCGGIRLASVCAGRGSISASIGIGTPDRFGYVSTSANWTHTGLFTAQDAKWAVVNLAREIESTIYARAGFPRGR